MQPLHIAVIVAKGVDGATFILLLLLPHVYLRVPSLVTQRAWRLSLGGTPQGGGNYPILFRHSYDLFLQQVFRKGWGHRVRRMRLGQYEIWIFTSLYPIEKIEKQSPGNMDEFQISAPRPFSTYCLHCCALRCVSSFLQMGTVQANWLQMVCRMQVSNSALRGWRPEPLVCDIDLRSGCERFGAK